MAYKKQGLKLGKLDHELLQKLIGSLPKLTNEVIVPPGIGLDAAGLKIGKKLIAISTDPITFSTTNIGTYSVAVNVNDVACLGCRPRWYLGCLLLPAGITKKTVENIWRNLAEELKRYQIQAIGGHIEVTSAVTTPVIVGQMIGEALTDKLLTPVNGKAGDQILLWRDIAIEGTALLAKEKHTALKEHFTPKKLRAMQNLLHDPGICIWPLVEKLLPCKGVVAIHDITEGGIATALHELADAAHCGLKINGDAIAVRPETLELAKTLHINPLGLLASGSALILCRKNTLATIYKKLGTNDLSLIGELTNDKKRSITAHGKAAKLPRFDSDEIVKVI